ncbi:hypothetical protein ACLOJK_027437 [Asimina triloba]
MDHYIYLHSSKRQLLDQGSEQVELIPNASEMSSTAIDTRKTKMDTLLKSLVQRNAAKAPSLSSSQVVRIKVERKNIR